MAITLAIEYTEGKKKKVLKQPIQLPQSWRGVGYKSMYDIAPKLQAAGKGEFKAQKQILEALIKNGIKGIEYKSANIQLDDASALFLLPQIEWMYSTPFGHTPFKEFKHDGTFYYMPASLLGNGTLGEFAELDDALFKYVHTDKPQYLLRMLAIVARPARPLSDPEQERKIDKREKLVPQLIGQRMQALEGVDSALLFANFQYVRGCFEYLQKKYEIFDDPSEKSLEQLEAEGPNFDDPRKKGPKRRWKSVITRLGRQYKGDYWAWYYEYLHTALVWLDEEKEENKRIKEEIEKQRNQHK